MADSRRAGAFPSWSRLIGKPRLDDTAQILLSLYIPAMVMSLGQGMVVPTIPALTATFEVSAGLAAQLVTGGILGRGLSLIPAGVLIDRFGRRPALIAAALSVGRPDGRGHRPGPGHHGYLHLRRDPRACSRPLADLPPDIRRWRRAPRPRLGRRHRRLRHPQRRLLGLRPLAASRRRSSSPSSPANRSTGSAGPSGSQLPRSSAPLACAAPPPGTRSAPETAPALGPPRRDGNPTRGPTRPAARRRARMPPPPRRRSLEGNPGSHPHFRAPLESARPGGPVPHALRFARATCASQGRSSGRTGRPRIAAKRGDGRGRPPGTPRRP